MLYIHFFVVFLMQYVLLIVFVALLPGHSVTLLLLYISTVIITIECIHAFNYDLGTPSHFIAL